MSVPVNGSALIRALQPGQSVQIIGKERSSILSIASRMKRGRPGYRFRTRTDEAGAYVVTCQQDATDAVS